MKNYVILLRGVTPTGKNRVPMADLRKALILAGLQDVQTYIQSGNVVTRSERNHAEIQSLVHDVIANEIGADLSVIVRTHQQVKNILKANPFPLEAVSRTYFTLLESAPDSLLVKEFNSLNFAPETIAMDNNTIYTLYATKHSDSKINNNFFERKLKVAATTRNFNTLSRLVELST